jgi:hypothetical protein
MSIFSSRRIYKISICIASLTLAWFALGATFNTIVAHAFGKRIDIVICSGMLLKKVSVPLQDSDDSTSSVKHCSNAPIYKLVALPGVPVHLNFAVPCTVAVWQYKPTPASVVNLVHYSRPPPGRAPPTAA